MQKESRIKRKRREFIEPQDEFTELVSGMSQQELGILRDKLVQDLVQKTKGEKFLQKCLLSCLDSIDKRLILIRRRKSRWTEVIG